MEELFGIPTTRLMWTLLAVFGAGTVLILTSALRNRVSFRMAARNLPRRRAQTGLVILGLMLATMLFSASFTTGDTLTNSLRLQALENLGQVDVQVQAQAQTSSGGQPFGETTAERASYFDQGVAADARDQLSDEQRVAGVAPLATETVLMKTSAGDITLELDRQKAPVTVGNFLAYVDAGYYDGTIFHRVIDGFMIQGGGFDAELRRQPTRQAIVNEAANGLRNQRGTIAMARTNVVDSATSQFFINLKDNSFLNHRNKSPQGFGYAVFGKVVAGMEVVDLIAKSQTVRKNQSFADLPVETVVIESVRRIP